MIDALGLRERARQELERRLAAERGRYYTPNGGIEKVLHLINEKVRPGMKGTYIFVIEGGNGVGKSSLSGNLAAYLSCNYPNPFFDRVDYLKEFRRPNRGRILTTATAAETAYDEELAKWMPAGRYRASKNNHKFNQKYQILSTKSAFDILTFKQDPMEGESVTLDWAIVDEPCSRRHFSALKSRFRFGGIIIFVLTPLEGAAWMQHQLLSPDRLNKDVFHIRLSAEENCKEHGIRGLMDHQTLEDMWRDFDEDELEARRDGLPLALSGSIYKNFRMNGHVFDELPPYYQDCWDRGLFTLWQTIDPHDRRPWFCTWDACFPNGASFQVAEWPDDSMRPFHKIKSWAWGWNQYAKLTVETEKALGQEAYATIMDPNYGPSATMDAEGVTSHAAEFAKALKKLKGANHPQRRMFFPPDAISEGHVRVKQALGDPTKGVTPEMYFLSHCRNTIFSMVNYGYAENKNEEKGLSEAPVLQFKDGADTRRYLRAAGARYMNPSESLPDDVNFAEPMRRYSGINR